MKINIDISSIISNLACIKHSAYYRDCVSVMRFLLEYKSFRDNLSYILIRFKIINNIRIYIKIYINN